MKTSEIEAKGLLASELYDLSLSVPKFYPLDFTHLRLTLLMLPVCAIY